MPRSKNSANTSYYHYLVKVKNDEGNIVENRYCTTQTQIKEIYGLNRSACYYLMNPVEGRVKRKYLNYEIEKVLIPVYEKQAVYDNGIVEIPMSPQPIVA